MSEPTYYLRSEGQYTRPTYQAQLHALRDQGGLQAGDELTTDHVLWDRVGNRPDLFAPDAGSTAPASPQPPNNAAPAPPMVQLVDNGPAPSPRPARRNRLPDEYDDDYDDAPPPRSSSGSGLVIGLIIFGVVGFVLVVIVCLAAISYLGTRASMTFSGIAQTLPTSGFGGGENFRLTHANYERIRVGMTLQELEVFLGPPTKNVRRGDVRTVTWQSGNKEIVVRLEWPADRVKATEDGKADKSSPTWD